MNPGVARWLCLLLSAAALPAAAASAYGERLASISALGPRRENGAGEAAALSYIRRILGEAGIPFEDSDFSRARGAYSASRIVEVFVPGERRDELAFVAPLNTWQDAAGGEGGAAGLACLLSQAERYASAGARPPISLRFVFLGADRRGRAAEGESASLGSRTWIDSLSSSAPRAVVYLSLDSGFAELALGNAGRGIVSPLWLFDRSRKALAAAGSAALLGANRLQLFRLGLADRYGPEAPYLAAGIPTVELRGLPVPATAGSGMASEPSAEDQGSRLSAFVDALVAENAAGFPESWDRHYLIFEAGRFDATVRETSYVSYVLGFCAAAAALFLALTVTRRAKAKALLARLPLILGQVLALYAALSAVYLVGNAIARFDALALGSGEAWRLAPRVFVAARLLSSLLLFLALISMLVYRRALSSNPYFYEFAALICLGLDVFVFTALNLPLSFPFLWALVFVALSLATRKAWATIAAFGLMYLPLAFLALDLALDPMYAVYGRIVAPGTRGALLVAAITLPFFIFALSPLLFFAPRGALARKRAAALFLAMSLVMEISALAFASARAAQGSRGVLSVSETIDQDAGSFAAELRCWARLGSGSISRGPIELGYSSPGDSCRLSGVDTSRRISIAQSRSAFLDRCTDRIGIRFEDPPFLVRLLLRGEGELGIYDCGLPYRVALDGRSAEIFAAANPGAELSFPITVPLGFSGELEVEAEYLDPPVAYRFPDGSLPKPGRFLVRASAPIAGED